jgi:aldose 1-epimerase
VIDFDPALLARHDYTGTPVLYPTPNRVRGGVFRWRGRTYRQVKAGRLIVEHGLAHGEPWRTAEPAVEKDGVRLGTWLEFRQGSAVFEAFPFPHRIGLDFRLTDGGLSVTYTIRNAHNLYDRDFTEESGLKNVPPGQSRRGSVTYAVSY